MLGYGKKHLTQPTAVVVGRDKVLWFPAGFYICQQRFAYAGLGT